MSGPFQRAWARCAADPTFVLLLVAVVSSLIRVGDQPSVDVAVADTSVSLVPADVALVALGAVCAMRIARHGRGAFSPGALGVVAAGAVFAAWILVTALTNSTEAVVSGARVAELSVLMIGIAILVVDAERLSLLVSAIVAFAVVAGAVAVVGFAREPGSRQASFVGEHDLAALGTLALSVGLAALFARGHGWRPLPVVAGVTGALCITLGAALSSLLGLYLVVAVVAIVAAGRGGFSLRGAAIALAVTAAITLGTVQLRSGDLGFLGQWFGEEASEPGQYAGGWSQRLIYAYLGWRVFAESPVTGTGWEGNLPAEDFARFLPAARARFDDQPDHYFPTADGVLVPQQAYDQILVQLGIIGAILFAALVVLAVRQAVRGGRSRPIAPARIAPFLPVAWLAAIAGVLAGSALFGGTPIAAMMWIAFGLAAAAPAVAAHRERVG